MSTDGAAATLGFTSTALEVAKTMGNVSGNVFVVTGAYSGIGAEATKAFLAEGGTVVVAGRSQKLQDEFVEKLKKDYDATKIDGGCLVDLGDFESVKKFADYVKGKYESIVLVNNAGVMMTPPGLTKSGFEQQMGINVIGHFLLSKLLIEKTKRQVWLSSSAHAEIGSPRIDIEKIKSFNEKEYKELDAYQQSKLGNILLAKEFHKRYSNVEAASLHPGVIPTNLGRHLGFFVKVVFLLVGRFYVMSREGWRGFKTEEQGASTTVLVATTPNLVNGGYYRNCQLYTETESAKNADDAAALFDFCDEVTKAYQ